MKNFILTLSLGKDKPQLDLSVVDRKTLSDYVMLKNKKGEFVMTGSDETRLVKTFLQEMLPEKTRALLFDPLAFLEPEFDEDDDSTADEDDCDDCRNCNGCDDEEGDENDELDEASLSKDLLDIVRAILTGDSQKDEDDEEEEYPPFPTEADAPPWAIECETNLTPTSDGYEARLRLEISDKLKHDFGVRPQAATKIINASMSQIKKFCTEDITDALVDSVLETVMEELLGEDFDESDAALTNEMDEECSFPKQGKVTVYTDGSSINDYGGWGVLMRCNGHKQEISGSDKNADSSRMELMAVVKALEFLNEKHQITLFSDSKYIVNGVNKGLASAVKNAGQGKKVGVNDANADLWDRLFQLLKQREVTFCWVKGHNGVPDNERCDRLASNAALNHSHTTYSFGG